MPHLRFLCLFSVFSVFAPAARAQSGIAVPEWIMPYLDEAPPWLWPAAGGAAILALLLWRRARRRAARRDRRAAEAERRAALITRRRQERTRSPSRDDQPPAGDTTYQARGAAGDKPGAALPEPLTLTQLAKEGSPEATPDEPEMQKAPAGPPARQSANHPEESLLLDFFAERFSLADRSADAAIGYMNQLAEAIERLKAKAEAAEARANALDDALRRSGQDANAAADPVAAGWRIAMDGARSIRIAAGALKRDPDFMALSQLIGFEDAVRRLTEEQARSGGSRIDPHLVEEDWPHTLWRAEALLSAYFPTTGDWGDLRHGVSVAAAAIRQMLLSEGVAVGHVRMLAPYSSRDGEAWSSSADGLAAVAPIRARARRLVEAEAGADLVIDCEAFGFSDERRGLSPQARLITLDRDAWT